VLKHTTISEYAYLETSIIALFGYASYLLAEGTKLSGIVAILFCGIVQAQYAFENLSEESKRLSATFLSILALLAETLVFGYLGLALFTFEAQFDVIFCFAGTAIILIARAFNVYPLSFIVNKGRKATGGTEITQRYQFFMWFAGLRGAIAFVLSLDIPTSNSGVMRSTTIVIIFFTIFVMGGLTIPLLETLRIPTGVDLDAPTTEDIAYGKLNVKMQSGWKNFDDKILKPFFLKPGALEHRPIGMQLQDLEPHKDNDVELRHADGTINVRLDADE